MYYYYYLLLLLRLMAFKNSLRICELMIFFNICFVSNEYCNSKHTHFGEIEQDNRTTEKQKNRQQDNRTTGQDETFTFHIPKKLSIDNSPLSLIVSPDKI